MQRRCVHVIPHGCNVVVGECNTIFEFLKINFTASPQVIDFTAILLLYFVADDNNAFPWSKGCGIIKNKILKTIVSLSSLSLSVAESLKPKSLYEKFLGLFLKVTLNPFSAIEIIYLENHKWLDVNDAHSVVFWCSTERSPIWQSNLEKIRKRIPHWKNEKSSHKSENYVNECCTMYEYVTHANLTRISQNV